MTLFFFKNEALSARAKGLVCAFSVCFLVTACATGPNTLESRDHGFPAPAAEEVFAAGYESVASKYLEQRPISDLAIEAVRGLAAIDAAFTVGLEEDRLKLYYAGKQILDRSYATLENARQWAALTTAAVQAGRIHSDELLESDPEKVYEAVFDGMVSGLDIYTRYAGAREARRNRARRDGFGGIGLQFDVSGDHVRVKRIWPDTPAAEAGILPGDYLISADGVPLSGLETRAIVRTLRGLIDTDVLLVIERPGQPEKLEFSITRRHVVPQTVTTRMEDGILIMRVGGFNQRTADSAEDRVRDALITHGSAFKGVIMDLRGNPGGLLRQSVRLANLFLTQGRIISTQGRHPDSVNHYDADGDDILKGRPLVVLVDGKSASASEITAATLQDRNRAVLIGTTSYGKGSVQTVIRMPNDGELTMTWSRLMAPSGYTLHGLGVLPAVCTSGNLSASSEAAVQHAIQFREATVATMNKWRKPGLLDDETRGKLRAACPAERHKARGDIDVAKRLILNERLYKRALNLSSDTAQATH